jgi:hypothetical protein
MRSIGMSSLLVWKALGIVEHGGLLVGFLLLVGQAHVSLRVGRVVQGPCSDGSARNSHLQNMINFNKRF